MAVNFFPQIKINSRYLTSNEADGGTPYIAAVRGLDALAIDGAIQVIKALNGTSYLQVTEDQLGKPITIEFPNLLSGDYDDILTEIQAYVTSATAITVDFTGAPYGNITSLSVVPDENPVRFPGEFENGRLKNVSIHLLTN